MRRQNARNICFVGQTRASARLRVANGRRGMVNGEHRSDGY